MRTLKIIPAPGMLLLLLLAFSFGNVRHPKFSGGSPADSNEYVDGTYEGESRAQYTAEHYWGHVRITIEDNFFTGIDFTIRDSLLHEVVDSMYGVNHYSSIPVYMQQCVNEDHAIPVYPQQLLQTQSIDEVDAISGATWSHNIFIASSIEALKNAVVPSGTQDKAIEGVNGSLSVKPNPFHSSTIVEYELTEPGLLKLSIYDNTGKLTKQLVNELQQAGNYSVAWNDCPAEGIYFCRMQMNDKLICNKIVRIK